MKRTLWWTVVAGTSLMLASGLGCSGGMVAGVGTTNGCCISATASGVEGVAPPYSSVLLFDINYIPYVDSGLGITTSSDDRGCFHFKAIAPGAMNVVVMDTSRQNAVLFDSLVVGNDGGAERSSDLSGTGAITGVISCDSQPNGTILVYCTGTDLYDLLPGAGDFIIPSVPQGTYKIQAALLSTDQAVTHPTVLLRSRPCFVMVRKDETSVSDTLFIK